MIWNYTHYHQGTDGKITLFELGECESCGGPVVEANAIGGHPDDIAKYKARGLTEYTMAMPPEIDVNPDTGECFCDNCWSGL